MIYIVILEDNKLIAKRIKEHIEEEYETLDIHVDIFGRKDEAERALKKIKYSIIFWDFELIGGTTEDFIYLFDPNALILLMSQYEYPNADFVNKEWYKILNSMKVLEPGKKEILKIKKGELFQTNSIFYSFLDAAIKRNIFDSLSIKLDKDFHQNKKIENFNLTDIFFIAMPNNISLERSQQWIEKDKSLSTTPDKKIEIDKYFGDRKLIVTHNQIYLTNSNYDSLESIFKRQVLYPFVRIHESIIINIENFKRVRDNTFVQCVLNNEIYNIRIHRNNIPLIYNGVDFYCTLSKNLLRLEITETYLNSFKNFLKEYNMLA